ncbi:hypothetical protein ACFCXS_36015 [Streptomyces sp. NPDC056373]|uniref:hypothetical protein n=1 Tax=Streptomyces sp. NPDC056373 TaxID=3345798 RepID=UPI0035DFD140
MSTRAEQRVIHNAVLGGSEPDPAILRAGEDHCIATSTFGCEHADDIHAGRLKVFGVTGAMPGPRVQDLDGAGVYADFAHAACRTVQEDGR